MAPQRSSRSEPVNYTDPLSLYGRAIIDHFHVELEEKYNGDVPIQILPGFPDVVSRTLNVGGNLGPEGDGQVLIPCPSSTDSTKVGIIGAGVGGLYAAMMLQSLDIDYEVLEASDRVGGRLYTYNFSKKEHDYFDVGAMRFPDTPMMKRTFDLFDKLTREANLSRIEYIFENPNSTLLYNGVLMKRASSTEDPSAWDIPGIPSKYAQQGWSALVENVVKPFADELAGDFKRGDKQGWKLMMDYDQYSTRAYMSGNRLDTRPELDKLKLMPYPTPVVNWLEMFDKSSGWYDRALSETVLESLAFAFPQEKIKWWCVDGGSQVIAEKMASLLTNRPATRRKVTAIALQDFDPVLEGGSDNAKVELSFADPSVTPLSYGHVISTVPLPCLRTMDLSRAWLTPEHETALRELRLGPAVKIGVKFKTSWWTDAQTMEKYREPDCQYGPIVGGQSYSDRMVRTVVYPSYGEGPGQGPKSTVLIVSYCWTDDANRWSALFGGGSEEEVKDIVLRDLVAVHGFSPEGYQFLKGQWVESYHYSWGAHPESMGAYGFFGPGQFSYTYTHMTQPAAIGRLHFAGEALSTRHAWVVGALDASWRAVYEILQTSYPEKVDDFKKMWGSDEDWTNETVERHVCYSLIAQGLAYVQQE